MFIWTPREPRSQHRECSPGTRRKENVSHAKNKSMLPYKQYNKCIIRISDEEQRENTEEKHLK